MKYDQLILISPKSKLTNEQLNFFRLGKVYKCTQSMDPDEDTHFQKDQLYLLGYIYNDTNSHDGITKGESDDILCFIDKNGKEACISVQEESQFISTEYFQDTKKQYTSIDERWSNMVSPEQHYEIREFTTFQKIEFAQSDKLILTEFTINFEKEKITISAYHNKDKIKLVFKLGEQNQIMDLLDKCYRGTY